MTEIPTALSPLGVADGSAVLAAGPFVVKVTNAETGQSLWDLGFELSRCDDQLVVWTGNHPHRVTPAEPPVVTDNTIEFTQEQDGTRYVIRPLLPSDNFLNPPIDGTEYPVTLDDVTPLATVYTDAMRSVTSIVRVGENNLYLTKSSAGEPLALVKMSGSHGVLVRDNSTWRPIRDDEDGLFGVGDVPVREPAVLAWDVGDIATVKNLVSSDRFSPDDAVDLWCELDARDHVSRLLLRRSRNRVYSRENGYWVPATPNPAVPTVDVEWGAIDAWDDGDLAQLAQVAPYDAEGDQAA